LPHRTQPETKNKNTNCKRKIYLCFLEGPALSAAMSSLTRWTDDFLQHNVQHFWIQNTNKTNFVPLPCLAGLLLRV
jgi:hypothetical protein